MSASKIRAAAILSLACAADFAAKKGYLVTHDGVTATLSASATVRAKGVIIEPNKGTDYTREKVTVALLGATEGTIPMCAGGAINPGDWVQQDTDGQVLTDAGTGNRVIVGQYVGDAAAVAGDIIEVAPCTPLPLS